MQLYVGQTATGRCAPTKGLTGRSPQLERAEILLAWPASMASGSLTNDALMLIAALGPDVLVKGADWAADASSADLVEARAGVVVRVPVEAGFSTSAIVQKIRSIARRG